MEGEDEALELLEHIIGVDAAKQYIKFFAGQNFYTPERIIKKQVYHKIREDFKNGVSYRDLGAKYGYSERYIRKIVHQPKK